MPVEETASAAILPSFLDNSSETIQTIYQAAASHQEIARTYALLLWLWRNGT